jgi:hypothetical protein
MQRRQYLRDTLEEEFELANKNALSVIQDTMHEKLSMLQLGVTLNTKSSRKCHDLVMYGSSSSLPT